MPLRPVELDLAGAAPELDQIAQQRHPRDLGAALDLLV
jgi:hypothetical protein